jgi:serine O-acetyltransferase
MYNRPIANNTICLVTGTAGFIGSFLSKKLLDQGYTVIGIAINNETVIGKNVNITKGVTIGQTNRGNKAGTPTIGNCVWIGANATVVGHITIGDNVLIAPNAYVNENVPNNSIVIGNPCKIIYNEKATENYIINLV